ncbi:dihydrolipoyl dehydrogenase [Pelagibius marinus]|uniref:dihydrolipoyl dehydrogenase n=1 Tax=Pelagibius marinus TaxID=2762760 RepID=UPI0018721EC5|nr:dihydrolipoyl dehydrogenase [Pelagibius marinus]
MADTNFDLIVVGGGPGGYVSAIRAAQLKMKVCVVERAHLGGICLNWGCIPTKALLRSAEIYEYMQHADAYGLSAEKVGFDLAKVVQRSRSVSKQLNGGVGHLLKKNKVTVVDGEAKLNGPGKLVVTKDGKKVSDLTAKHVILATGARPRALPGIEPDKKLIWTYFEAMVPDAMPKSLLVIGSGAIGIEFASFFHSMGADVTVVEVLPQIMPVEDEEISKLARKQLEKRGLKIMTEAKVTAVKKGSNNVTATVEDKAGKKSEITVDRVISAVGVQGNIEDIGLETTKVKTDRGCIVIDDYGRTAEPGIYAIGDVAGPPMLAHKAEHEGVICVEKIAGLNDVHPMKKEQIPGCTYCHPQVASVGLTEKKAKEAGYQVKVGRFPFIGNGKAIALGEPEGMVKTVFDAKTGQLLGAHMVGAEVTELIQGYVVAMGLETTEAELMHTVFPHPTLSEMMHESVLDAYGRVIHM